MRHKFEILFPKFRALGQKIQLLGGIVQNNVIIDDEQLEDWKKDTILTFDRLKDLFIETVRTIRENNTTDGQSYDSSCDIPRTWYRPTNTIDIF